MNIFAKIKDYNKIIKASAAKDKEINSLKGMLKLKRSVIVEMNNEMQLKLNEEIQKDELAATLLKEFLYKTLTYENTDLIYDAIKFLDKDGWYKLSVIEELIPCDIYNVYYYEDNIGVFEDMIGYNYIKYYEINAFAEREYEMVCPLYEKMSNYSDYSQNPEYLAYISKLPELTIYKIIERYPYESMKVVIKYFSLKDTPNTLIA